MRARVICAAVSICCAAGSNAQAVPLAVASGDGWRGLWRPAASAPARWAAPDSVLATSLRWRRGRSGIAYAEFPLRGDGEAWRTRAIAVRIDPSRVQFVLDTAFRYTRDVNGALRRAAHWRSGDASVRAVVAVNAGQFEATLLGTLPWGWVAMHGREWQPPGVGPLSTAVVIDSLGVLRLLPPDVFSTRDRMRAVAQAFQSFPTLLEADGAVPAQLRTVTSGVDLSHRDARLAIGTLRDGTVLIVMTRFDAFGPTLGSVPFGLTTPEMSALMGALGCQRAVMLDGGISAQLQLRDAAGALQRWPGWRRVPLGLLVLPR